MKKIKGKPKYNFTIAPDFTEKEIKKMAKLAEKGNFHAKIDLMMHNQRIIDYKLTKLIKK